MHFLIIHTQRISCVVLLLANQDQFNNITPAIHYQSELGFIPTIARITSPWTYKLTEFTPKAIESYRPTTLVGSPPYFDTQTWNHSCWTRDIAHNPCHAATIHPYLPTCTGKDVAKTQRATVAVTRKPLRSTSSHTVLHTGTHIRYMQRMPPSSTRGPNSTKGARWRFDGWTPQDLAASSA